MELKKEINQIGFTLIEVVFVSFIGAILLLVIFKIITDYYKNYTLNQQILAMQDDASYAMDAIINGFYLLENGNPFRLVGIKSALNMETPGIVDSEGGKPRLSIKTSEGGFITSYYTAPIDNGFAILCSQEGLIKPHTILPRIEGSSSNLERYSKIDLSFKTEVADGTRFLVRIKIKLEKTIWDKTHYYELEETVINMPK